MVVSIMCRIKNLVICLLGHFELSQLSVRVSNITQPWINVNEYVECGFRNEDGPGKGESFTIVCENKPHGRYIALVRTGGEHSGQLVFCEAVVMGHNIIGKY